MNMRIWGGWFLVVIGVSILMTIGCDKGSSGVRTASLKGRVVDATQPAQGVAGARVTMISSGLTSTGGTPPLGQMKVTIADENGYFYFPNVMPDSVKIEVIKPGFTTLVYPQASGGGGEDPGDPGAGGAGGGGGTDTGGSSGLAEPAGGAGGLPGFSVRQAAIRAQSAPSGGTSIEAIWVTSGNDFDVGVLYMERDGTTIVSGDGLVAARLIFRDKNSQDYITPEELGVTAYFDGTPFTYTVKEWREGITVGGNTIKVPQKAGSYTCDIRPATDRYKSTQTSFSGSYDIVEDVLLESRSYDILLRCTNVPDSLLGEVINVYAETIPETPASSAKVVATHSVSTLGSDLTQNLPNTIRIDGISLPINLRVQVKGYRDEVLRISSEKIPPGTQGIIRVDVNFLYNNQGNYFTYDPLVASQGGMLDNRIGRTLILRVSGLHFTALDTARGLVNGVERGPFSSADQMVDLIFPNIPVGRNIGYLVTVTPQPGSIYYASGAYNLPSDNSTILIPPETEGNSTPFYYRVNAIRP